MKRTEMICLALLGGSVGFNELYHGTVYRDQYASRADCISDWGINERDCQPATTGSGTGGRYYGPSYERGARPQTYASALAQGQTRIARGGFGSSGARFGHSGS